MQQTKLGNSGIVIPRLFIGTGTDDFKGGILQAKMLPETLAAILKAGYDAGVNFWDTAGEYHTHRHIKLAMQGIPRESLILATKTYGGTSVEAVRVLDHSLKELDTPYVDIFHFHSVDTLEGFQKRMDDALNGLKQAKQDGKIKAIGLSTHNIHVLEKAVDHPGLDVIFTNFNKYEIHMDASLQWYSRCLNRGHQNGKGILVMKTIGEGRLRDRVKETIQFNLAQPFIHGVCVGIKSMQELEQAVQAAAES